MSRIKTTLDSVTKAVGSTDIISKFSRLRQGGAAAFGAHTEKVSEEKGPPAAAVQTASAKATGDTVIKPPENEQKRTKLEEVAIENTKTVVTAKPFIAANIAAKTTLVASATKANATSTSSTVAKQTLQLFHPSAISASMDETYNTLSQQVNSYFGSGTHTKGEDNNKKPLQQENLREEKASKSDALHNQDPQTTAGDHMVVIVPVAGVKPIENAVTSPLPPHSEEATSLSDMPGPETTSSGINAPASPTLTPSPTVSPKKGLGHYFSYPQALVGSYIAPLVPKFRADSKSVAAEKEKSSVSGPEDSGFAKTGEKTEKEESAEEKAKKLQLSQREKIIARVSVDSRTRALVKGLQRVTEVKLLASRVEDLNGHLLEFPETRGIAINEKVLPNLLRLRQARDASLQAAVREALALLGYTDPVKGRGIRVLAIDGGGTRGLVCLQTLHRLQTLTGKPIHQLFDYICGVSTGAILAFMLGVFRFPVDECEEMYRKLGSDVFKQNVIVGTVKMGWSHAFYDSTIWENILKERMGEGLMFQTARDPDCPKVSTVSTLVNRGLPLKAYVFRNYSLPPGVRSHYLGDCKHKMWQAIRASSAAPGYFQEFMLGKDLHQDGGLMINNPTALAIHECKSLWPNTPVQCVVSLGTGRYETAGKNTTTYTSLKTKINNVISSATDTEEVHTMLDALLPPDTYFRFNPYMSEEIALDESRRERLNFLQSESERYLDRNTEKLQKAASVLCQEKSTIQRLAEWANLKADMYEGFPFSSKL